MPKASSCRFKDWQVEADFAANVGTAQSGGPLLVRILVLYNVKTRKYRVLWTSLFSASPKQIIKEYILRWRVEIVFCWLKTEFELEHVLCYDLHGLMVYYLLLAVVCALLLLYKAYVLGDRSDKLSISE